MPTIILPLTDETALERALAVLGSHGLIVSPTDTVYGVMCRYDSQQAVQRLFEVKRRPLHKAIPILIGEIDQLSLLAQQPLPAAAAHLAERFWPGALTLILPARDGLPAVLTAGGRTVGVRMPDHPALRDLLRIAGPLAATSANLSGEAETHTAQQAYDQLGEYVSLVLSDDDIACRTHRPLASTVVDLTSHEPVVVRRGPIADEVLAELAHLATGKC